MSEFLESLNKAEAPVSAETAFEQEAAAVEAEAPAAPVEEVAPAPAPIENAAPAPVAEQAAPEEHEDRMVPRKALQEERAKRQEMERRIAQMEAFLSQQAQPQQQQQFEVPDPETDPIAALKYDRQQLEQLRQAEMHRARETQFTQVYTQAAQQFSAQAPDFQDAYKYAINSRAQELQAIGTPPQAISQALRNEEMSLVATALQNGVNPAEAIYNFAKARGYAGKAPAPAPAPVAPGPDIQKARQAVAASAAAGGKPATPAALTWEAVANLKGAAFDSAFEKLAYGDSKSSLFRR
jgi:hypothetical protein